MDINLTRKTYINAIKRLEYEKMHGLQNSFLKVHSIYNLHYP